MRLVIAPDSFKGSLTAVEVAQTVAAAAAREWPELECKLLPMADGGEGTVATLVSATGGVQIPVRVTGPRGGWVDTFYGVLGDGVTAALEVATVAGLPMVPLAARNPMQTTTQGLGEVMQHALSAGYRKFVVGLGGSATNDGGIGLLQALGACFNAVDGQAVPTNGWGMTQVAAVNLSGLDVRLRECEIRIAVDVDNPLCGPLGASVVFGPQKGATPAQVALLDAGMNRYANLVERELHLSLQTTPGAGAAGGLGFAFMALGAIMIPGAQLIGETVGLEAEVTEADWVLTGEGQSDAQTLHGKLPFYVARVAHRHHVPTILLSASLGKDSQALYDVFASIHAITPRPMTLEEAMAQAHELLFEAARNLIRVLKGLRSTTCGTHLVK
ncbi:glycerate kinase [Alicyclobacillaceae bacterium I2511]|nr:glycerate kinase [Alicyclobacillaceae bacterium I2511]